MDDAWGFNGMESVKGRSSDYRKWEGEDEEDYVMDSWDQEPEEEGETSGTSGVDRSEETLLENGIDQENGHSLQSNGTSSERSEERLDRMYLKRLQEEADLKIVKEMFGPNNNNAVLDSEESYSKFKAEFLTVIEDANKNVHYASFTEDVVQNLCNHLSSNELKRIVIRLSNLQIQKNSSKKGEKKKPKGKLKVKLRVEDDIHDYNEYSAYLEDDGYI